ncbi:IL-6 subfamily cytokine M17 [Chanos chanos]|uniref:Ciliary neurotrophic factor n=1 Tax=Chanos chanos TaxID=29144 RepID=A0A6J2WD19_CHACN|nr:uncharacterized protein LOC115823460 [Chanos chanos]
MARNKNLGGALLSVLLFTAIGFLGAAEQCDSQSCGKTLRKSLKLTRVTLKNAEALLETYKKSQGDFAELYCQMAMENIPGSSISGQVSSERMVNVYTRLKEFLPHLKMVAEQQTEMQIPSHSLFNELTEVQDRTGHVSFKVNCLLQILMPNMPIPEPPKPTGLPPSLNYFQKKVYGCVVLTRLKEFLMQTAQELRTHKDKMCMHRTPRLSQNY